MNKATWEKEVNRKRTLYRVAVLSVNRCADELRLAKKMLAKCDDNDKVANAKISGTVWCPGGEHSLLYNTDGNLECIEKGCEYQGIQYLPPRVELVRVPTDS